MKKLTEHLIFLALMMPTVSLLAAAAISLAAPAPSFSFTLDAQTSQKLIIWAPSTSIAVRTSDDNRREQR